MDPDSSLAAVVLGLSMVFYGLLSLTEGYLWPRLRGGPAGEDSLLHPALWDETTRSLIKAGLIAATVASGAYLLLSLDFTWWAVALGALGLLVFLPVFQGVLAGLGARLGTKARIPAMMLWPLALPASLLSRVQISVASALSRGGAVTTDTSALSNPYNLVALGELPETDLNEELDPHEEEMIRSILKLDETTAREIMIPRMDILAAEATSPLSVVAELMWNSGHSRIPIYEETIDNIVGVVHSRDLLRHLATGNADIHLASIARPPLFIPVFKRLDDLLRDFQEQHIQVALVVDEYGGTTGLVTIEDLLEEIVGEIEDEFDTTETLREMVSDDEALMDARISLDEVNEAFDANLQGDGFDTLGGLLYHQLGRVPIPGDEAQVNGLNIRVITTLGRRIKRVRVARPAASESPGSR